MQGCRASPLGTGDRWTPLKQERIRIAFFFFLFSYVCRIMRICTYVSTVSSKTIARVLPVGFVRVMESNLITYLN